VSDSLPPVWSAEPHTLAKHRILQEYLAAWMAILSHQSGKLGATTRPLKYIDAFAGPGIYQNGEEGSPILALKVALNHARKFPVPVDFVFIEDDEARYRTLEQQLLRYRESSANSANVHSVKPVNRDCRIVLNEMLDAAKANQAGFGPALVFLDQFGYSGVPMNLIARILAHGECEVLTFFFWRELDRFISDKSKHSGVTGAFGGDEWLPAIDLAADRRVEFMSDAYVKALRTRGGAKFVWPFAMFDDAERLLAWLFFCTNSLRGLEEMKKAMWKVDRTGGFSFSDKHGLGQLTLLTRYGDTELAADIKHGLAGRTLSIVRLKEWVLMETPAYKFKGALALLEKQHILKPLSPPPKRRVGQFADETMLVELNASGPPQSLFG
jgi:three-Cys-motif partner protein